MRVTRKTSAEAPSGSPATLAVLARPGDDALRDGVRVGHLALVAHEGGHLALHGRGRLHGDAGLRPATAGAHDPQLRDAPGLEPFVEQLGVRERVAGVGVHRAHGRLAGGQVVGMAGEDGVPVALGRLGQHALGPDLADDPADVAAQLEGGLHHAVGMTEEVHVAHADHGGRGPLLVLAQRCHVGPRHRTVGSTGVAVRDDAVGDLDPGRREGGDRAGRPEVDVVGMGGHDEDSANPVLGRPRGDGHGVAQRTLSSARGVHAARSASRGSLENISTMGIRSPSRRWITSISTNWFHRDRLTTTPALPARAVRPERCR